MTAAVWRRVAPGRYLVVRAVGRTLRTASSLTVTWTVTPAVAVRRVLRRPRGGR